MTQVEAPLCPIRICPICGYTIKDADFENPSEDSCSEEKENVLGIHNVNVKKNLKLFGKDGTEYYYHGAFSLMTEKFPDSVHRVRTFQAPPFN